MSIKYRQPPSQRHVQTGFMTMFTGVLILLLLTLMMFFAMRVGVFEQRVSSNEMRQKLAFHAAESGIHNAKEYFRANSFFVASAAEAIAPDTSVAKVGGVWPEWFDGWLSAGDLRWLPCKPASGTAAYTDQPNHPCQAESAVEGSGESRRDNMYYYSNDTSRADEPSWRLLPFVDTGAILPGDTESVDVYALLCVLDVVADDPIPVKGCVGPGDEPLGIGDGTYYTVTLMARGQADCGDDGCNAEALISEQVSNFGASAGGRSPKVPLTTKSSFVPNGTAEVVPNPNAGGLGVPASVWLNANTSCGGSPTIAETGNWNTCEMHEWFGQDSLPESHTCPGGGACNCTLNESISWSQSNPSVYGIDLIEDPEFPCDLFQFYFGVPKEDYEVVKGYSKIIDAETGCPELNADSSGIYWVTSSNPEGMCWINSNTQIGSKDAPILLISAAPITRLNGGAKIFGTLYVTDAEYSGAKFWPNGTNTVYGSVIVDALLDDYNGTFQVVWDEYITRKAGSGGGLGAVLGGWSDNPGDWVFQ